MRGYGLCGGICSPAPCVPTLLVANAVDFDCWDQIVLGSIVTRCPSMSLAPSALVQLDSACELFAKAAAGFGAQKVLVSGNHHWLDST